MGIETAKSASKALRDKKLREAFTNFNHCRINRQGSRVRAVMVEKRLLTQTDRLAPDAAVFLVSAVKGDDIPAAADWLAGRVGDRAGRSL